MRKLKALLLVIAAVQGSLGLAFLFLPAATAGWMGLAPYPPGLDYLLGMLAARFLAYGIGLAVVARAPVVPRIWIDTMILIQALDLAVGILLTARGVLGLGVTAFPMFNATVFCFLLVLWRPRAALARPGFAA